MLSDIKKGEAFITRDGRTVALRPFKKSDADEMLRFANSIVREKRKNRDLGIAAFDKRLTRAFERKFLDTTIKGMRDRQVVSVAAFSGGNLVGECMMRRREPRDLSHTALLGIVIQDSYRGVGLGEELMRRALLGARKIGVWLVELEVISINHHAIRLYEKMGFHRVGVIPNKVQRDGRLIDIVVMYADIRQTINPP